MIKVVSSRAEYSILSGTKNNERIKKTEIIKSPPIVGIPAFLRWLSGP
jgi:hypothetical protein